MNLYHDKWLHLIVPLILIAIFGHLCVRVQVAEAQAQELPKLAQQLHLKDKQIIQIAKVAEIATASTKPVTLTDDQAKTIIAIVIPTQSARDRFFNIVKGCENKGFNPLQVHWNNDGSYDLGFGQINSKWHAQQVKQIFGEDFDVAMKDPAKNIMFSAWLYQNDKNFHAWVCDKLI